MNEAQRKNPGGGEPASQRSPHEPTLDFWKNLLVAILVEAIIIFLTKVVDVFIKPLSFWEGVWLVLSLPLIIIPLYFYYFKWRRQEDTVKKEVIVAVAVVLGIVSMILFIIYITVIKSPPEEPLPFTKFSIEQPLQLAEQQTLANISGHLEYSQDIPQTINIKVYIRQKFESRWWANEDGAECLAVIRAGQWWIKEGCFTFDEAYDTFTLIAILVQTNGPNLDPYIDASDADDFRHKMLSYVYNQNEKCISNSIVAKRERSTDHPTAIVLPTTPTFTPKPTHTPIPTDTPSPTDTSEPTSTATPTPTITNTPSPTATPTSTPYSALALLSPDEGTSFLEGEDVKLVWKERDLTENEFFEVRIRLRGEQKFEPVGLTKLPYQFVPASKLTQAGTYEWQVAIVSLSGEEKGASQIWSFEVQ